MSFSCEGFAQKKRLFREIEFWRNSLGGRLVAPRAKGRKRPIEFFFFALLLLQTLLKSLEKAPQAKEEEGKEEREPSFLQSVSSLSLSLSPARFRTFGERNSPNSPTNKNTFFGKQNKSNLVPVSTFGESPSKPTLPLRSPTESSPFLSPPLLQEPKSKGGRGKTPSLRAFLVVSKSPSLGTH